MKLLKHLSGYLPVSLSNGLVGAGSVYVFTRLLGPEAYGRYGLLFAAMALIHTVSFTWVEAAAYRFARTAQPGPARANHIRTGGGLLVASSLIMAGLTSIYAVTLHDDPKSLAILPWLVGAMLANAIVQMALETHRADQRVGRYVGVELSRLLGGFTLGVLAALLGGFGAAAPFIGMAVAGGFVALREGAWLFKRAEEGVWQQGRVRAWASYGWPIATALVLDVILSVADRFLIDLYVGKAAVGAYTAGYGLADKTVLMICAWAAMAGSPLLMEAFERGEHAGVRHAAYGMVTAILLIGVPAAMGLALVARPLAEVMVDAALREQATRTIPWIAFAGLLNGILIYYVVEAFNLTRRTALRAGLMFIPVAANISLNLLLLPIFGLMGAVYATVISYGLGVIVLGVAARRLLILPIPLIDVLKIGLSCLIMGLGVQQVPAWGGVSELCIKALFGVGLYGLCVAVMNPANVRGALKRGVR